MPVKDQPKSCCKTINLHSFYYDDVTREFFKTLSIGDFLRSMDVIHFDIKNNVLIFGEMTSYNDYAARAGNRNNEECLNFVRTQLLDNGFRNKIVHSIFTLIKIIDFYNLNKEIYSHLFDTKRIRIKNYLVMDLTFDEYLYLEFSCLHELERHRKFRIEGEVDILNCEAFEKKLAS